jgi:acyl dehydratase
VKFEDFHAGQEFTSAPYTVERGEMQAFSSRYDPQPIHVDDDTGKAGPYGDVIGSGFLSIALAWRLWLDLGVQGDDGIAGLGLDGLRWRRPLLAGTTVRALVKVVEHRVTSGGHGLMTFEIRLVDEADAELVSYRTTGLHARRERP